MPFLCNMAILGVTKKANITDKFNNSNYRIDVKIKNFTYRNNFILWIFKINKSILKAFLCFYLITITRSDNSQRGIEEDTRLVAKAARWFDPRDNTPEYEQMARKFNDTENTTLFVGVHQIDHIIKHPGFDDEGRPLVIISDIPSGVKVPYKCVTTLIVLRHFEENRYTSHLAYVRNFGGRKSVEWDLYSYHYHVNDGNFASAFVPIRDGPYTITIGMAYTLSRTKKRESNIKEVAPFEETEIISRRDVESDLDALDELETAENAKKHNSTFQEEYSKEEEKLKPETETDKELNSTMADPTPREDSDMNDVFKLNVPFIGTGDCDYVPVSKDPLPTDLYDLIDVYIQVLRFQCEPTVRSRTIELFSLGLLSFNVEDNVIMLNYDHELMTARTMDEMDWLQYASAVLLSEFSIVFGQQHQKYISGNATNLSPNGKSPISGTAETLTFLTLQILEDIKTDLITNAIKLCNLLLVILQGHRSDLATGKDELNKCRECKTEKEINFNDHVQIYALMRFLVDEIQSVIVSSTSAENMFENFYEYNYESIDVQVRDSYAFVF